MDDRALIQRAQHGDRLALAQLVKVHTPWLRRICHRWPVVGLEFADLLQAAQIGFLRAIESYDLDSPASLRTYAEYWIKNALTRATQDAGPLVQVPSYSADQHSYVHLDAPAYDEGSTSQHDITADPNAEPSEARRLDAETLLSVLTERERQIVDLYFAADDPSFNSIAKCVGLSPEHTARVFRAALAKLRRRAQ